MGTVIEGERKRVRESVKEGERERGRKRERQLVEDGQTGEGRVREAD